jgi:Fur family zinc uptake transcriptional regulator
MDEDERRLDNLLTDAQAACAARGERLTSLRRAVLRLLLAQGGPVKAYDLQELLRCPGKRVAPASVYRSLNFLIRQGFVHRVNTLNAYVACTGWREERRDHYPLMLVCSQCAQSVEISGESVYGLLRDNHDLASFFARTDSVEIQGTCRRCGAGNPRAPHDARPHDEENSEI